jgi:tetratricopeptide (TPR) repeat protein
MPPRTLLTVLLIVAGTVHAQNAPSDVFSKAMAEMRQLVGQQQYQQALAKLDEADAAKPNQWTVMNARGNVYLTMRDFTRARECYKRSLDLNPEGFETRFNLAEVDYVEGRYDAAVESFQKLTTALPNMPVPVRNIILFKIIVSELKLNHAAEAEALIKESKFSEQSPASYFANASLAFYKGQQAAADDWLARAQKSFKRDDLEPYMDALIEARMIAVKPGSDAKP